MALKSLSLFSVSAGLVLALAGVSAKASTVQCQDPSSSLKMSLRMTSDTSITDVIVGPDGSQESFGALQGVAPSERNSPCGPGLFAYNSGHQGQSVLICLPNYLVSRGYEKFQGMIAFHSLDTTVVECSLSKTDLL